MDDFDRLAKAVHDRRGASSRGASWPKSTDAERRANIEMSIQQDRDALARLMREGGSVAEFLPITQHLHGSSRFGWPAHLVMAVADPDGQISGKDCWDIVLHCFSMPPAPYPESASDVEPSAKTLEKLAKPGDTPKGSAPPTSQQKKARRRSPEKDALLRAKILSVLAAGRSLKNRYGELGPDRLSKEMSKGDRQGFSAETVGQILSGRYPPMKRFDLKGIFQR